MPKVTIHDIARESKVSIGTVYRAVNNSGRINEETRKRVLETVEKLGYKANSIARGLALRSKFNILVIMPHSPESFWKEVIKGARRAADELSEFGVQVTEFFHKDGICEGRKISDILSESKIDAIAMAVVIFEDCGLVLQYAKENKIPVAVFNDDTVSRERLFFYGPDNCLAGRMAAELMYKFCGRKGTFCTISNTSYRTGNGIISREKGFEDHLKSLDSVTRFAGTFRCSLGETPLAIRQVIHDIPDLDGIYFCDFIQLVKYYQLFNEMKRRYVLVGHEYSTDYGPALRNGTISALLSEEKVCQGYYPIKILYQYLMTGEKPTRDAYFSNVNIIIDANAGCLNYSKYGCGYE